MRSDAHPFRATAGCRGPSAGEPSSVGRRPLTTDSRITCTRPSRAEGLHLGHVQVPGGQQAAGVPEVGGHVY
eukprot:2503324-Pyramimonas_sp.AAC.1